MAELEQFCILAKTQKSRACAALIQQVLNHKKIYVFGELLALPSVQSLNHTEFSKSFNSLELFAFGTYRDYLQNKDSFLELTDVQLTKLKQLSIVSLAAKDKVIPYSILQRELDLPKDNIRALEDLVIETMYVGLMTGKIDQRNQRVRIRSAVSRDVKEDCIGDLVEKLRAWKGRCEVLKQTVAQSSEQMKSNKAAEEAELAELQAQAAAKKQSLKEAIESGVDPRDLEDGSAAGAARSRGGPRSRHASSSSSAGGGGGGKSFGKRLISGLTGYGGERSGHSRGPPGGGGASSSSSRGTSRVI